MSDPGARSRRLLVLASAIGAAGALGLAAIAISGSPGEGRVRATLVATQALSGDPAGYERVTGPRPFAFPSDHGPHPGLRTEWWYVTGNLSSEAGRRFGFQLTFFRSALAPEVPRRDGSAWNTNQVYMGHFALTDIDEGRHDAFERFARGALGLAGATGAPFRVWLEDWVIAGGEADPFPATLHAADSGMSVELSLASPKPAVLQGDAGYSPKGPEPGNASHYYSFTRLTASGTVTDGDGVQHRVDGSAWMDREWGTSVLSEGVQGWDWFALQLDDGRDVMFFRLRGAPFGSDFDGGVIVDTAGEARSLGGDDFALEVRERWSSPLDGAEYPVAWTWTAPGEDLALEIRAAIPDQEMNLSFRYWEGAVIVRGRRGERDVHGVGYAELTGYGGAATLR